MQSWHTPQVFWKLRPQGGQSTYLFTEWQVCSQTYKGLQRYLLERKVCFRRMFLLSYIKQAEHRNSCEWVLTVWICFELTLLSLCIQLATAGGEVDFLCLVHNWKPRFFFNLFFLENFAAEKTPLVNDKTSRGREEYHYVRSINAYWGFIYIYKCN